MRVVTIALITAQVALGAPKHPSACDLALDACLKTVQAQSDLIVQLKDSESKLADQLAKSSTPKILPTWAWVVLGLAVGVATGSALHK